MTNPPPKAQHCPIHDDVIVHEKGGPDMPTVFGRDYCPTCQAEFMAFLDSHRAAKEITAP